MDSNLDLQKLAGHIKDIKFSMFSTITDDGSIISRPMANREFDESDFDGRLWFFTKKDTAKVHSIERDAHVNLAYADPKDQRFISISGVAFLSEDEALIRELWSPSLADWFPEGVDDPELALIGVDIQGAELWDALSGNFAKVGNFVSARRGQAPEQRAH